MKNAIIKSLGFCILFDALWYGISHLTALAPPDWSRLLQASLVIPAGFALIWIFLKSEQRKFTDIGLVWDSRTLARFLMGILVGTALFAVVLFALVSLSGLELKRSAHVVSIQTWLVYLVVITLFAFMEELGFRSYALLKMEKAYGLFWTQIIMAIVFALHHVVMGWSWQVSFLGPGAWAFIFGLGAILSRGIALPTGIHAALNLLQILVGMKADKAASLWTLELKQHAVDAGTIANRVGLSVQISILIAGIIATYLIAQKRKSLIEIPEQDLVSAP